MRAANRRSAPLPRSDSRLSPRLTGLAAGTVGDTVLDPFSGSGALLVGPRECGATVLGCDIGPTTIARAMASSGSARVRPAPEGGDVAERARSAQTPDTGRQRHAADGAPRIALVVHIRRPQNLLDSGLEASHTADMVDPLVAALAQLVRDRWNAGRRERTATRARMRVLEGEE